MTFRGPGGGNFAPVGVIFQAKDFDKFADTIGGANRLLQGLNRNIAGAVGDFNALGRSAQSVGRNFNAPFRNIQSSFRGFGNNVRRGVQDLFFIQSAARQAANTIGDLGQAFASPVNAAVEFEDAFAGVTKTVDGLSKPLPGQNLFSSLTADGEELLGRLRTLSNEIPVTFEELSALAGLGGQLGITQTAENIDQVVDALESFTRVSAGLGEATTLTSEQAGTVLAQISNIFQVTGEDLPRNIEALGASITQLGNTTATTETNIAQLGIRLAGAVSTVTNSTDEAQADVLALAAGFSSVGVRAEAGGTAVSQLLLQLSQLGRATEGGLVDNTAQIDALQDKLQDLSADLVRLEAQSGLSGEALVNELSGLSGEALGRVLGDSQRERLFNLQTEINATKDAIATLNEGVDLTLLGRFADVTGLTTDEFQRLAKENPVDVLVEFVEGLNRITSEGGDAAGVLDDLGITSVRAQSALLRMAGAGGLLRRIVEDNREEFAFATDSFGEWVQAVDDQGLPIFDEFGKAVLRSDALTTELENRYSTTASALQTFQNQIKNAAVELGRTFLPVVNRALDIAQGFIEVLTRNAIPAVNAFTDAFAPLGAVIVEAFSGFDTGSFATQIEAIIRSVRGFDVTPLITGFQFIVDNGRTILSVLRGLGEGLAIGGGIALLAASIAALANPFGQLVLAVTAARVAWDQNFLGFRDIVVDVAATISPILDFIANNIDTIGAALAGAFAGGALLRTITFVGGALATVGAALAALVSPIGLVVAGGAALAAAWQTNFGGFRDFTLEVIDSVREGFGVLVTSFQAGTFDPIIETVNRIFESFGQLSGLGGEGGFDFTALVTGGIDTFFTTLNDGLTNLAENWTAFETAITLGLPLVQSSFENANTFIANLPNPITAWLGGDGEDADIGQAINQSIITGLESAATDIDEAIQRFTTVFDQAVAAPEGGEQSPGQVFVDRFLEPFRNIELPDIDLSPLADAFENFTSPETLQAFADGFGGVADALARFDESAGGDTIGRIAESLGTFLALRLEQRINELNAFADAIGRIGEFTATYATNIGQFFSALIEIPIQQVSGITEAFRGLGQIAGAENLRDVGGGLSTFAQGLLDVASAPFVNLAEVFTGQEIEPPELNFSSWGVQISEAIAEIQRVFSEVDLFSGPDSQFGATFDGLFGNEEATAIADAFRDSIGNAIALIREDLSNLFSDITFTPPDLSVILEPFSALATQIKALFSPAALFADLTGIGDADLTSIEGIRNFFSSLFSDGEGAGEDLDTGLAQGIDDNASIPVEAAKNMSERVINEGIYLPLAVRSPSEITRQAGADVVAGFALGLQDITPILEQLQVITTTIIESFTQLGIQLGTLVTPNLFLLNEQFTLSSNNLLILNENTASYTPVLQELRLAFEELGATIQNAVIPPMTALDALFQAARGNARRLERNIKDLAKAYRTLASALQAARRAGSTSAAIPSTPAVNPPAFQSGGSFITPSSIPENLRGPTGGMLIEVHPNELVQIFNRAMTREITGVPQDSIIGRPGVREPAFSGAGITNQISNIQNTTNNNGENQYHLHVTSPVSNRLVDNFDLLKTLSRTR